jgi:phage-related holin
LWTLDTEREMKHETNIATLFVATLGSIVTESLESLIVWFIVMFSVIFCDLVTGVRKSWLMKEQIRITTMIRKTLAKTLTYFSFVVMVVLLDYATREQYHIGKYAILFVCLIEGVSIFSNILKPVGYSIDLKAVLAVLLKRFGGIEKEDGKSIVVKEEEKEDDEKD